MEMATKTEAGNGMMAAAGFLFSVCGEKTPDNGEDSFVYALNESRAMVGVFDGGAAAAVALCRLVRGAADVQLQWAGNARVYLLDGQGRRSPLGGGRKRRRGFAPVIRNQRLSATLYVGLEDDGALTVEALGLAYALLEALGKGFFEAAAIRPTACFDKNICALRLTGIGRFVLAQNILEYLKGNHTHAKR